MQRIAILFAVLLGFCAPLLGQQPAPSRVSVTVRYQPNGGNVVTATIPEAVPGSVTLPLQVSPASLWVVTVTPSENEGMLTVSVTDNALTRPPGGPAAPAPSAPVTIVQGTYPFAFGRPVTVMQSGTFRLEVLLTPL